MYVSKDDLPSIIKSLFKNISDSGIKGITQARKLSVIVDEVYQTVEPDLIRSVLSSNPLLVPQGMKNRPLFDCDDFALQLKSQIVALHRQKFISGETSTKPPAIGIIITQSHVLNFVVVNLEGEATPTIIDPSSANPDFLFEPEEVSPALKMKPIRIIYI